MIAIGLNPAAVLKKISKEANRNKSTIKQSTCDGFALYRLRFLFSRQLTL